MSSACSEAQGSCNHVGKGGTLLLAMDQAEDGESISVPAFVQQAPKGAQPGRQMKAILSAPLTCSFVMLAGFVYYVGFLVGDLYRELLVLISAVVWKRKRNCRTSLLRTKQKLVVWWKSNEKRFWNSWTSSLRVSLFKATSSKRQISESSEHILNAWRSKAILSRNHIAL